MWKLIPEKICILSKGERENGSSNVFIVNEVDGF